MEVKEKTIGYNGAMGIGSSIAQLNTHLFPRQRQQAHIQMKLPQRERTRQTLAKLFFGLPGHFKTGNFGI